MAQFDVYTNPSKSTRRPYPYIVDIQSPVISELSTRIVIPLARKAMIGGEGLRGLTPEINYEGDELLLLVPQIASMPAKLLNNPIGSLSHFRDEIIPLVEDHGLKLRAFFRTLVGPMGEYTELWDFESVAQFETQWHQVMQDSRLAGIFERTGPMVEDEQLRLLEPVES